MTKAQKLELRRSEVRERLAALADVEGMTDEQRSEVDTLTTEYRDIETRWRAATVAEDREAEAAAAEYADAPDRETRERVELRSKASLGRYLRSYMRGRLPTGAEAELREASGILEDGDIPLELWDTSPDRETRDITGTPGTVGLNLDRIRPAVFAPSILPRLGVEMPRVPSGTYATATIDTSTTAGALAKSGDAPATAATFNVTTSTVKRISARLELTLEDIAAVGTANFESALRENLSLALSDELDRQGLTGDGQAPNLTGILQRLTTPTPATDVATFDDFVAVYANGVDGLWASKVGEVAMVAGVDTYRLAARTFRDATGQDLGDMAFSDYAMKHAGGFWTNKRMPATASTVQHAILYRMGRTGIRRAVCPHWGRVSIDDVYTGSIKAERYFTAHVLLGDVILVQPDAYAQVSFKVA